MRNLTLKQFKTIQAIVTHGKIVNAAKVLSLSPPAVTIQLRQVEEEIGLALFDRTGHRPVLTGEGKALLANARDILLRVDAMRARARGLGEGVELELSLVVDTLFPVAWVGEALRMMRQDYPSVAIRLAFEPLGGPLTALLAGRSTLAVITGENFRDPRVVLQGLSSIEIVAVAAAGHPLATRIDDQAIEVAELADHLQIVQVDPTTLSQGRDFGVLSPQTCRVGSQDTKHAMILAGLGWGRLPAWQVERDLREGRLVRLHTKDLGRHARAGTQAYLAHRLDEPLGPAARAFGRAIEDIAAA